MLLAHLTLPAIEVIYPRPQWPDANAPCCQIPVEVPQLLLLAGLYTAASLGAD